MFISVSTKKYSYHFPFVFPNSLKQIVCLNIFACWQHFPAAAVCAATLLRKTRLNLSIFQGPSEVCRFCPFGSAVFLILTTTRVWLSSSDSNYTSTSYIHTYIFTYISTIIIYIYTFNYIYPFIYFIHIRHIISSVMSITAIFKPRGGGGHGPWTWSSACVPAARWGPGLGCHPRSTACAMGWWEKPWDQWMISMHKDDHIM